jgi:N-acetylglucosamine repressor
MEKATREQTKFHNTRLVLKTIYQKGDISRADIARFTRLTRTTVSDIVGDLIESKLLVETGIGSSGGGKPPIILRLQENARQFICIDLSGSACEGAVINLRGKILRREQTSFEGLRGDAALASICSMLDGMVRQVQGSLIGIGIGVPGLTDPVQGVVRRAVHLDWSNLPLKHLLEQRFHLPVYLSNDSHAAAQAEFTFGSMRGSPNLILIRIGEGIGAGILLSGRIHSGDGHGAGEIGHLTVVEGGRLCSCGNYGCLETVATPAAIVQRVRELAEYDWISFSKAGVNQPDEIDWDFVCRMFAAGDETVTELIKEAGRYLGISIASLVSILNIRCIAISGRYHEFGDVFLDAVRGEVQRRALRTTAEETQIFHSTLDPDIILLGVSALVLSQEMDLP